MPTFVDYLLRHYFFRQIKVLNGDIRIGEALKKIGTQKSYGEKVIVLKFVRMAEYLLRKIQEEG